ncbi:hypothetical protein NDI56_20155 [Haloarcula sp. S1CR25-12]|uniref:Uncharacterized protein n=1 Tax=Haloarcula saliterrae TaxID=2950534 RepID=A0ABU2FHG9_9EURY|nr:hypothetical protein [Haloarcula sp. S1CR25-12]MDS0261720.1 hypothetical protein [Haloarcula sp. S1CR25-12]
MRSYIDSLSGIDLHTSPRVLSEAEDVVNERRRLAKQAAKHIFQDFEAGYSRPGVDEIVDFVWKKLSHCRDAAVDHVIQHIKDNEHYYTGLTQVSSRTGLQSTSDDIDDDFNAAVNMIANIRNQNCDGFKPEIFKNINHNYNNYSVFSTIDKILSGKPTDRDILLDSYHLTQEESLSLLYFVTMDGDFLDNESDIESCLSTVDVEHPSSI